MSPRHLAPSLACATIFAALLGCAATECPDVAPPEPAAAPVDRAAVERWLGDQADEDRQALLVGWCAEHGCPRAPTGWDTIAATAWLQTAAEARATSVEIYQAARAALPAAIKDRKRSAAPEQPNPSPKLPPAVILDVDETVLDNSPFQVRMIRAGASYDRPAWDAWCNEAKAPAIAGAVEFTQAAAKAGVTVFYVTNRDASLEAATRANLAAHGFPIDESLDVVLTKHERPEWGSAKGSRRAFIAQTHRIVMLVGDNLGDFVDDYEGPLADRARLVAAHAADWGVRWFMLPNPMYGAWEAPLLEASGLDAGRPKAERLLAPLSDGR